MNVIQQPDQQTESSRAKELDHGTIPLRMQNMILGIPTKPGVQFDNRESVNAIKWAYEQLVSQKQLLGTFQVPAKTDKNGTDPFFILQNSWSNIQKLHFRNLNDLFYVKSWKWHLTFEFRSNFQQVGMCTIAYVNAPVSSLPYLTGKRLVAVDNPLSKLDRPQIGKPASTVNLSHELFTLNAAIQLPHIHVMLGEKQDVCCTMNWVSPFKASYYDFDPNNPKFIYGDPYPEENAPEYDMGFIYLFAPFPMTMASGVDPNCTVRIWSHLTDVEYAGYCPDDNII
nr:MAG: putative capsid protein 1 [Polycipiviridae sp.]